MSSVLTALFGVTFQLSLTSIPPVLVDNLSQAIDATLGETIRVDWSVSKTLGTTPDTCSVQLYNLDPISRTAVDRAQLAHMPPRATAARLALFVGWGGVPEPLFLGPVTETISARQTGVDIVTSLSAVSAWSFGSGPPPGGAEFGTVAGFVLLTYAAQAGKLVSPALLALVQQRAAALPLQAWQEVKTREPMDVLDGLFATLGLQWKVVGEQIVAFAGGIRLDLPDAVILTPSHGLLNWTTVANGGLEFEALCQARVVPGCQLQFIDELHVPICAPLRCESVEFTGSSYGSSTMRGVARKLELLG